MTRSDRDTEARAVALANVFLDHATAQVVGQLRSAGIASILLKGPAVAHWLYDGEPRRYTDCDLLVAAHDYGRAEERLYELGYRKVLDEAIVPDRRMLIAHDWRPTGEGVIVDLHRTLEGVAAEPQELWDALRPMTVELELAGMRVTILDRAATAFLLSLHALRHGQNEPREELVTAIERFPIAAWREAVDIAERLRSVPAFAMGLRLVSPGVELADVLGLPRRGPIELSLLASRAPQGAAALYRFGMARGIRAKVFILRRQVIPPGEYMRLYWPELARRGQLGLMAAYAVRLGRVSRRLGPALLAWHRARREALK